MAVERSSRRYSSARLERVARRLLRASPLFALATVSPGGGAYVNTAYFAWDDDLSIVWLSAPDARHSRNLRDRPSAAIAVFDSHQTWGKPDRGVQLFGRARELSGRASRQAAARYARRFRDFDASDLGGYRLYRFRPTRLKLFDERTLGGGTFVSARVGAGGRLTWVATERYA